jgi:hypothetical protein
LTLPGLDAFPDVAIVRIGFGSHSQTPARPSDGETQEIQFM